jgi:hypothetical protein
MPRLLLLTILLIVPPAAAAPPGFDREVAPVLAKCVACHSGPTPKGELDLSRKKTAFAGGSLGPAVVAGKPDASPVWEKVSTNAMPPKKPLTDAEKATLKAWIESGATWGTDPLPTPTAAKPDDWWAFRPLPKPGTGYSVPGTQYRVPGTPIDRFILAKLEQHKLTLSPEADRRTLIRRLKFDLLGLPPTMEEVEAFAKDRSPDAYEKLVETFLASPQYGERWARHWLDVVRFAESHGFEMNQPRPTAWPYRDWVIASLNADKPYDRFVFEQLAGDAVGADAATGFLVAGPWDQVKSPDPALTAQQRADELHDIVSVTGSAFLGLTVGCARCHAHKFDPISQLDYYRLKAVFAGVQHGEREVRTGDTAARLKQIDEAKAALAKLESRLADLEPLTDPAATAARRLPVNPRLNVERFPPVTAKHVRFVVFATNNLEPCVDELEIFAGAKNVARGGTPSSAGNYVTNSPIHQLVNVNDGKYGNSYSWISNAVGRGRVQIELPDAAEIDRVQWGRDREGQYKDRLPTRYRIDVSPDGKTWSVVASSDDRLDFGTAATHPPGMNKDDRAAWDRLTKEAEQLRAKLAALSRADMMYVGKMGSPEPTFRLHRGDATAARESVGPGGLDEIGPKLVIPPTALDVGRRVAFAKWVTAHPLTARVIANRVWQYHFGTGLVDTPSDFGRNGGTPSHPELLDWLAADLVEHKWSLKHLHRQIVTSRTYRQSSKANADGRAKDAQSRLLWRYPPRRLEAEAIRDAILATTGKLDLTPGGPGFDLFEPNTNYVRVYTPKQTFGPAEFRRMVYQEKPRMQLDDTFGAFDCPDGGQIAPKRTASTTPLQSLNLLNGAFLAQQAGFFAKRIETAADPVRAAFRLAFQRDPSPTEAAAAAALVKAHGLPALGRAVLNANEFLFVD